MKLKKGDKLILVGFERDPSNKDILRILFETVAGNKVEFYADGEEHQYHCISVRAIVEKKFEEELVIP